MPNIADSTIAITTPTIDPGATWGGTVPVAPKGQGPVVRGILPPGQVLSPVTVWATQNPNSPTQLLWQPQAVSSQSGSSSSGSSSSSSSKSTTPSSSTSNGIPAQVYDIQADQGPYKTASGAVESLVAVSYHHWAGDKNFAGVDIWFTGYNGLKQPQLMASSNGQDPVLFTCEATGETVTVTVVAVSPSGLSASFLTAPTTTVDLSGVVNPPPPPTIAQPVTAISGGWQFQWNVLSGLIEDQISGYWIYKSTTDTTPLPPLNRIAFIQQPASNVGVLTYQDIDATTEYFWVSAVDTAGLESTLAAANTTTLSTSFYPTSDSGTYGTPNLAFDGNQRTSSSYSGSASGGSSFSASEQWNGFSGFSGTAQSVQLQVLSEVDITNSPNQFPSVSVSPQAELQYSLDGGNTWTNVYNVDVSRSYQYDYITLPVTQDLTKVVVQVSCSGNSVYQYVQTGQGVWQYVTGSCSVDHLIYEISIVVQQNET
jgi:hypothetical protein